MPMKCSWPFTRVPQKTPNLGSSHQSNDLAHSCRAWTRSKLASPPWYKITRNFAMSLNQVAFSSTHHGLGCDLLPTHRPRFDFRRELHKKISTMSNTAIKVAQAKHILLECYNAGSGPDLRKPFNLKDETIQAALTNAETDPIRTWLGVLGRSVYHIQLAALSNLVAPSDTGKYLSHPLALFSKRRNSHHFTSSPG